jgi:hypothetical protein
MRTAVFVLAVSLLACAPEPPLLAVLEGRVVAGPVCPVETDPPNPECAPRPVAGAELVVTSAGGLDVIAVTDGDGFFRVEVAAGPVTVVPQPVDGLLGTAPPIDLDLPAGVTDIGEIVYDTGIR